MNQDKYVFAQLVTCLDRNHFNYLVRKYSGNRYVKHFTCWNQLMVMMFGQLTNRESLRDLIVIIEAHRSKCYHLGFGKHVTKSNLAKANQNRDCCFFEEFAYFLVAEARSKRITIFLHAPVQFEIGESTHLHQYHSFFASQCFHFIFIRTSLLQTHKIHVYILIQIVL